MPNWKRCSSPSASCRFDWQPAPDIAGALVLLGLAAALAVGLSDLPRPWLAGILPLPPVLGALAARRWLRQPSVVVHLDRHHARVVIEGVGPDAFKIHWRCGVAVLRWRFPDGGWQSRLCLPWRMRGDVLRELRRWRAHSQRTDTVAP